MTERSDYQKLRAHLAFLRMGAAAEALPAADTPSLRPRLSVYQRLVGDVQLSAEVDLTGGPTTK